MLIGHWPLNGNTNDVSRYGNNGVPTNITYAAGKIGQAASFTGNNSGVDCGNITSSQIISYSAWARSTANGTSAGRDIVASFFNNITPFVAFGVDIDAANKFRFYISDGSSFVTNTSTTTVALNTWYHLAMVINTNQVKCYVNGILEISFSRSGLMQYNNNSFRIGTWNYDANNTFTGQINDVRLFNHALTDMEVQEIARAKILHYSFDDFQEPTTNLIPVTAQSFDVIKVFGVDTLSTSFPFTSGTNHQLSGETVIDPNNNLANVFNVQDESFILFDIDGLSTGDQTTASIFVRPNQNYTFRARWDGVFVSQFAEANKWTRISNSLVYSSANRFLIGYRDSDGATNPPANFKVAYSMPQLEKKLYPTEFTPTVRTAKVNDYSRFFNHSQNLTETNTPRWTSDAKIGTGAYDFNGVNNFIRYNQKVIPDSSNEYTFSVWAKPDGTGGGSDTRRFIMETSPNWAISCAFNSSLNQITMYNHNNNSNTYTLPSGNFIGKWTHIAGVFKLGSYQKLYVNGQEVSSVATLNATSSTTLINFGTYRDANNRWFGGEIDDVRIYTTALSDADILDLYQTKAEIEQSGVLYARDFTNEGTVVAFTNIGETTWTKPADAQYAEILIVGGGAGGGSKSKGSSGGTAGGAGGGAGGLIYAKIKLDNSTYNIKVGAGGAGGGIPSGGGSTQNGFNGENSFFDNLIAIGGGGGARNGAIAGVAGGSGGGASSFALGGSGTANQGNKGGDFVGASDTGFYPRAGGGGAGEAGGNAINSSNAGKGGDGLYFGDIFGNNYGENGWFAGGGGGSWRNGSNITGAARGGLGGGTNGGIQNSTKIGDFFGSDDSMPPAMPNTGGGGGGQGGSSVNLLGHASSGGSGIVLIKYYPNEIRENGNAYFYSFSTVGITDGLIAYLPLEKDGKDYSLSNFPTLTSSTLTFDSAEKTGVNFSSSFVTVQAPTQTKLSTYTYSFFLKITTGSNGSFRKFIERTGSAANGSTDRSPGFWFYPNTIQVHFQQRLGPNTIQGGGVDSDILNLNEWYHVVFICDFDGTNTTLRSYINNSKKQNVYSNIAPYLVDSDLRLLQQGHSISNFKLFNRALTDEEIKIEYNTMFNNQLQIHESGVVYATDLEQY